MDTRCLLVVPESIRVVPLVGMERQEGDRALLAECVSLLLEEALIMHEDRLLGWQTASASDRQWSAPSKLSPAFSVTLFLGADQSIIRDGVQVEISLGNHLVAKATVVLVFLTDLASPPALSHPGDHRSVN